MSRPAATPAARTANRYRMRLLSAAALLSLIAAVTAPLAAQNAADTIVRIDGSTVRGVEVTTLSLATVKFLRNKEEAELPAHSVVDIRWGNAPDTFVSGLAAMQKGNYDVARQMFGEAIAATDRAVLKTEARFLQAKATVGTAGADPAAAANAAGLLRAWLGEFADGWRVPEAMFLLGRALRMGNLLDDAVTTLKELDERAVRDAWSSSWNARAKYELGLCLLSQGKALDARSTFQSAGSAADTALGASGGRDAELLALKINARVGEGETLINEKQYQRAIDFFHTLGSNEDPSLAASGKAGEGEATFLLDAGKNDAVALRMAQATLAEACVIDTGAGDTSAKANYYLGRVLIALGERDGTDFKSRATAYFQLVVRNYPTSRWVGAAKAELTK